MATRELGADRGERLSPGERGDDSSRPRWFFPPRTTMRTSKHWGSNWWGGVARGRGSTAAAQTWQTVCGARVAGVGVVEGRGLTWGW